MTEYQHTYTEDSQKNPDCPSTIHMSHDQQVSYPMSQVQIFPKQYPIEALGVGHITQYPDPHENHISGDEDEDESEGEGLVRQGGSEHETRKYAWVHELIQVGILLCSLGQAVQIFILQYASPGSFIMMLNGYIAISMALITLLANIVRWTCLCRKGLPVFVVYLYLVVDLLGFTYIQSTTVTIIVFRQASEEFWVLFIGLPVYVKILSITTTIGFTVLLVLTIISFIIKRVAIIEYLGRPRITLGSIVDNEDTVHLVKIDANPTPNQNKKKHKKKKRKSSRKNVPKGRSTHQIRKKRKHKK